MRSLSHPKLRHFFRFITSDIDKRSLKISKKFIREHRKQILLNDVLLIVSGDDKVWHLSWTVSGDGKLWLQKGWPEFHQHYSLNFGHLLRFNLLGKSVFQVRIFDPCYQQINYVTPQNKYSNSEEESNQIVTHDRHDAFLEETEPLKIASEKGRTKRSKNRARESSKSYSVTVRDSYLRSSLLYAPVGFCRRYLTGDGSYGSCVLEVSNGGRWGPVDCKVYESYARLCGKYWKKFSDDNRLSAGDDCVFELIDEVEKVMKVTISRAC